MGENVFIYRLADASTRSVIVSRGELAVTSSGDTTLQSAATGYLYVVLNYTFTTDTDIAVKFIGGTTDLTGLIKPGANGGASASDASIGLFETAAGEALKINLSGAAVVGGHYTYAKVPVS